MSGAPTPPFLPEPFANDAGPGFINTIPATSADPQRASYSAGFPPQVMTPILAGGKPMLGPDMNGILNALSAHLYAAQAGQLPTFSSAVSTAVGGYAKGAVVAMSDGTGIWMSLEDANTTDPDAGSELWLPIDSYGTTTVPTTGGIITLTSVQARRNTIIVTGALVANAQINFPATLRRWLIINNTSGAFTVTVRVAGLPGLAVPQGGFSAPVEVYGNGAGLFPTVAPLTIPTAVAPTPSTYVLRSNDGYVYATYFNQVSPQELATISSIFIEAGGDGFLRKITPNNFAAQLVLSAFAGQVVPAQVPQAAVTQFAAAILANATLTGTPTAPTAALGTNSDQVATTAFAGGTLTVNSNGIAWQAPGGFVIQAGFAQSAGVSTPVTFPVPFPTAAVAAVCATANRTGGGTNGTNFVNSLGLTGMACLFDIQQTGPGSGQHGGYWVAVGR